jgi:hypothetical protein
VEEVWEDGQGLGCVSLVPWARVVVEAYRVDACGLVFFRETPHLECDLYEGAWYLAREDDAAQRVVHEGLKVALSWACILA